MNMRKSLLCMMFAAIGATSFSASATYATLCHIEGAGGCSGKGVDFDKIEVSNNQSASTQLDMQVRNSTAFTKGIKGLANSNTVAFTFQNVGGIQSSITNIFFDDVDNNSLFSDIRTFSQESGGSSYVKFARDTAFTSLPEVVDANFGFATNYKFSALNASNVAKSTSEKNAVGSSTIRANGINNSSGPLVKNVCGEEICYGEFYTFYGILNSGKTMEMVNAAINNGSFQIALNVVSKNGNSFVDTTYLSKTCPPPSTVPLPTAAWLFGSALIGFVTVSNRRRI